MRMTSGSSRSAYFSALWKDFVSVPTSRWLTMHCWWRWMNSIGSSTVMMCPFRSRLILSIIAASVVDFPEPVGPVTRIRPRGLSAMRAIDGGSPRSVNVLIMIGICRITIETQPRCLKQLPRKRARFAMPKEKSSSSSVSNFFFWFSVNTEYAIWSVSFGVMTCSVLASVMSPSIRSFGRSPAVMCRSDASRSIISSSSVRRLIPVGAAVADIRYLFLIRERRIGQSAGLPFGLDSRLTDDLLQRRDTLEHLEPAVHAKRQHPFADRAILDLGGADVLENQLPQMRGHEHDFVETLTALQPGAVALL